jgi:hypothetical protein
MIIQFAAALHFLHHTPNITPSHLKTLKHFHLKTILSYLANYKSFASLCGLNLLRFFLILPQPTDGQTSCLFDTHTHTHAHTHTHTLFLCDRRNQTYFLVNH